MKQKLFVGIADDNRNASVVVGDSSGQILATSYGGSVNYHFWGMEQTRLNLQNIIRDAVGWNLRNNVAGVCFTYKADLAVSNQEMFRLVSGFLEESKIQVEDFTTSSTLGINTAKDRLLLVGGQTGVAIFQDETGHSSFVMHDALEWNPSIRLQSKYEKLAGMSSSHDMEGFLDVRSTIQNGESLSTVSKLLDHFVEQGHTWALEVAYDVAYDLVRLVTKIARHSNSVDPVIGLYGQLLLGSDTIRGRVYDLIRLLYPRFHIVDAPLAPAKGAYLSSLLARRSDLGQEVITDFLIETDQVGKKGWINFEPHNSRN